MGGQMVNSAICDNQYNLPKSKLGILKLGILIAPCVEPSNVQADNNSDDSPSYKFPGDTDGLS